MWSATDYVAQKWLVSTDVLPYTVQRWPLRVERGALSTQGDIEELVSLWGIEIGEPYNGLFTNARLADGWKKDASPKPNWVRILDKLERTRGNIFYGNVRGIARASLILCPRFGIGWKKMEKDADNNVAHFLVYVTDGGKIVGEGNEIGPFGKRWWDGIVLEMTRIEKIVEREYPDRRNTLLHWD